MRPGPGGPYRGMGPGMFGAGPMNQGSGPFGGSFMRQMGPAQTRVNPMLGMGQPAKQGGGILAKILGKGAGAQNLGGAAQGATRAASGGGGILNALANPGSINGFLNNTQQVLKTAQQVGPMIQQYGPLVKNLPAMWKLYRGFKDMPDQGEEETKDSSEDSLPIDTKSTKSTKTRKSKENTATLETKKQPPKLTSRPSTPKLFY